MRGSHIESQNFFHRMADFAHKRSKDFWLFESSLWLHSFASSIISIFIPVLMLAAGFSLEQVLVFYIIYYAINMPANYLGRYMTRALGAKITIIIGTILYILFFVVYSFISTWEHLILLALLYGTYDGLYYVASRYVFIGSTKDPENSGENTGIMHVVVRSASLVGPLLGSAMVLLSGGDKVLLVSVIIFFFILSLVPLFFLKEIATKPEQKPLPFKKFFNNKREIKNHVTLALYKVQEAVEDIIFPIYIFLLFQELSSVAILAILVPIVAMAFSFLVSHVKRGQREKVIMVGSLLLAVVWLLRVFIEWPIFLYLSVILTGLFALLVVVPLDANLYVRGSERGPLSASMYRNITGMGAKLIFFIILYIFISVFKVSFLIAVVALFALFYVNYRYLRWRVVQPGEQTSVPGLPTRITS